MPRDLEELLTSTAVTARRGIDPQALRQIARARAHRRQAATAVAAVVLLAVGALAGLRTIERRPDVIFEQPPATADPDVTQREAAPVQMGPRLDVENLPQLPARGIAVQHGNKVVLVGLDGTVHGNIDATFDKDYFNLQTWTRVLRMAGPQGQWWVDPGSGSYQDLLEEGIPLGNGHRVLADPDSPPEQAMQLLRGNEVVAAWPDGARWWVTPDHRIVTWEPEKCSGNDCVREAYDTEMRRAVAVDPGCWVGLAVGDVLVSRVCRGGGEIWVEGPDATGVVDAGLGTDAEPASVTALFDNEIVRLDHKTCDISEVRQIGNGLDAILGEPSETPSAVPLGVVGHRRVVVHLNSAPCDGGAQDPGVYLVDIQSGERTLVWQGSAYRDDIQMWAPTAATFKNR